MTTTRISYMAAVAGLVFSLSSTPESAAANKIAANATGLPTYPNLSVADMDSVPRDTFGHRCTHYSATSPDALDAVEAWYRKSLAGAAEQDVNKSNLYGSYFKLNGIELKKGLDFMTIYRMTNQKSTSIEIFKCTS